MASSDRIAASTRPVRVLLACDHIDYDGALHGGGRQLIEVTRALAERPDVEPTVCVLRAPSELGRELVREGLPFTFFGDHALSPATLVRMVRCIREREIDVLHLTDYGASTFGRLAGLVTGRPSMVQVISHHSKHQRKGFPRYVELAYRALAPATAKALANSPSVRAFAVEHMGFATEDVEVLPCALPKYSWGPPTSDEVAAVRRRHGIPADAPVVGAVTRFYASKGMEFLIRAVPDIVREFPRVVVLLCGQGPQEEMLRSLARELGVERHVIFAGFQRQAHHYVAAFDVAATPSIEEGFGVVALEAQALGVPVVASRIGGLQEIILDEESGLLVEPADPAALAAAIRRLLRDAGLRRAMRARAIEAAQRFSLDAHVDRLSSIYHELAARRNGTRHRDA